MARMLNKEDYETRRSEILEAAQRLVYIKGYEQMSIQDILDELHISKGGFYHYFDSKQALLEALIERMAGQVIQLLNPLVQDSQIPAPDKLCRVFDTASRWKTNRKDVLLTLAKVWYADKNALLRLKSQAALLPQITPLITSIVIQGVGEGLFHTDYPEEASRIIFSLLQSFGDSMIPLMLEEKPQPDVLVRLEALSASHQDAVERVLGAEPGTLPLFDITILREWFPPSISTKE